MIRRLKFALTLVLALVFTFAAVATAQTVSRPIEDAPEEVFLVEFRACGNIDAKGKGVAIVDSGGNSVPFKIVSLDPEGVSILAVDPKGASAPLTLQYSPKPVANAKVDESIQPSLILQVFPLTGGVKDFEDAIRITQSTKPIGTMAFPKIDLGYNPFGASERFIALFTGVLSVEDAGKYQLFSINDDAAWLEIDGRIVIAHPRAVMLRDREKIPESATTVELSQGRHKLRYLLIANQGRPVAQLGRVAGKQVFTLPPSWFGQSKSATLGAAKVEAAKPLIGFDVEEVDQISIEDGAYLRFNFRAIAPPPQGMKYRWDFGDGGAIGFAPAARQPGKPPKSDGEKPSTESTGGSPTDVEHVFAVTPGSAGTWKVTLELVDAKNATVASAATSIRPGPETRYATIHNPDDLARFAGAINAADYTKATPEYMHSLYQLIQIAEQPALAAPLADQFVKRFGTRGGAVVWDMKYTLAQALSRDEPERAEKLFLELALNAPDSWKGTTAAAEDIDLLLFRLGAKPDDVEQRISRMMQGRSSPRERALIRSRLGDYFRLTGKLERAEEVYKQAQDDVSKKMDAKQAAVLDRAYREQAQSLLTQRRFPAMRDTILQWEADFPLAKMGGDLPLLNGRYFQAIGDDPRAAIEFKTLLDLNPLHPSKPEIVYRLAESLERLGKNEEAKRLYRQVAKEFPNSPFAMPASNRAD